ncbi:MAG: hypothetical protein J6A63_09485, partial [Clostridia bacterium]|nr:hypothetical protein [Clostridia bacterium]
KNQNGTNRNGARLCGDNLRALRRMTDIFEVVGYAEVPEEDLETVSIETFDLNLVKCAQMALDLETEALVERCLLATDGIECDYKGKIEL